MQAALEAGSIALKMQLLKVRANKVLKDKTLRHMPNEHDIKQCSNSTKLLHTHQQNTIERS